MSHIRSPRLAPAPFAPCAPFAPSAPVILSPPAIAVPWRTCGVSTNHTHPSRVGRFVIAEPIGRGTLGEVYAGVEEHVGRRVAVRVGTIGDLRVHQQARVTGQVAHPNVVSVLDLGEDLVHPFDATELVEGTS